MGERNFHLHGNSFNRRAIGTEYETLACEYLIRHGYQILCRNFRCRQGEIDIIARDRDYLVFIEVKYRRDEHEGDPAEAVDYRKQKKISRVAEYYCWEKRKLNQPCRFDVICVLGQEIRHIENAFDYR